MVVTTLRYRIKDASEKTRLDNLARAVNLVWNYCNETSSNAIRNHNKFLSAFDLHRLTAGSSKELGVSSTTIQAVCERYVVCRVQFKKRKLRWRISTGPRRSLGWIPFKSAGIQIKNNRIYYHKHGYKVWWSRPVDGRLLCGSFSQDAQGHWYVNLTCEVPANDHAHPFEDVGVDLGLKTSAVLSNGTTISNTIEYCLLESKLGKAQHAHKKRLARKIHAKIKNRRMDYLHKETTKIAKKYRTIFVGNVSGKFLQAVSGKSSQDASIGIIRNFLKYKAIRHSGNYIEVNESFSTVTCSSCFERSGPSGLSDLGVREWVCSRCHACHDRDINAAKNILRFGRESLRATA